MRVVLPLLPRRNLALDLRRSAIRFLPSAARCVRRRGRPARRVEGRGLGGGPGDRWGHPVAESGPEGPAGYWDVLYLVSWTPRALSPHPGVPVPPGDPEAHDQALGRRDVGQSRHESTSRQGARTL